jgi:hypothetical protein
LQNGGDAQRQQRQPDGADAQVVVVQGAVGGQFGIAMIVIVPEPWQMQRRADDPDQTAAMMVMMMVVIVMMTVVVVLMVMFMLMRMIVRCMVVFMLMVMIVGMGDTHAIFTPEKSPILTLAEIVGRTSYCKNLQLVTGGACRSGVAYEQ